MQSPGEKLTSRCPIPGEMENDCGQNQGRQRELANRTRLAPILVCNAPANYLLILSEDFLEGAVRFFDSQTVNGNAGCLP